MTKLTTNAIEAQCRSFSHLAGGFRSISFKIHSDDAPALDALKPEPNKRYALAIVEIADDEEPAGPPAEDGDASPPSRNDASASDKSRPSISPEKRLVQQAVIMCNKPDFRLFLEKTFLPSPNKCNNAEQAAIIVRLLCEVESRSEIIIGTPAGDKWDRLMGRFSAWDRGLVA